MTLHIYLDLYRVSSAVAREKWISKKIKGGCNPSPVCLLLSEIICSKLRRAVISQHSRETVCEHRQGCAAVGLGMGMGKRWGERRREKFKRFTGILYLKCDV